jgi:putative transposase
LLFRPELDKATVEDIRLALSQNQPLGNARFHERIEKVIGVRREAKPRGRPSLAENANTALMEGQGKLEL